jgi:hypothetical protein
VEEWDRLLLDQVIFLPNIEEYWAGKLLKSISGKHSREFWCISLYISSSFMATVVYGFR